MITSKVPPLVDTGSLGNPGSLGNAGGLGCFTSGYVAGMPTDELDDYSGVPRWRQIAGIVEAEIRAGVWPPGGVAPSRNTVAQRFGVAGETARHALVHLAQTGYVVGVPGVGMVVTPADRWPEGSELTFRLPTALQ